MIKEDILEKRDNLLNKLKKINFNKIIKEKEELKVYEDLFINLESFDNFDNFKNKLEVIKQALNNIEENLNNLNFKKFKN